MAFIHRILGRDEADPGSPWPTYIGHWDWTRLIQAHHGLHTHRTLGLDEADPGSPWPMCEKFRQLLAVGRWFPPGTAVSSTRKTDFIIIISPP